MNWLSSLANKIFGGWEQRKIDRQARQEAEAMDAARRAFHKRYPQIFADNDDRPIKPESQRR